MWAGQELATIAWAFSRTGDDDGGGSGSVRPRPRPHEPLLRAVLADLDARLNSSSATAANTAHDEDGDRDRARAAAAPATPVVAVRDLSMLAWAFSRASEASWQLEQAAEDAVGAVVCVTVTS